MRYLIDISNVHNDKINSLIQGGKYQSIASFLYSAIENQLHLESSTPDVLCRSEISPSAIELKQTATPDVDASNVHFLLSPHNIGEVATIEAPKDSAIIQPSDKKGSDSNLWIWGQINKIFPLKVGLRVLGNMIKQNKTPSVDLNIFKETAANTARSLGLRLMTMENNRGIKRGNRVSTGLPIGKEAFNSESRYKNHFLASARVDRTSKIETLDGALAKFKFINIEIIDKKEIIGITKEGLEFAILENPILDKQEYNASLSSAETDYYLRHVAECVPGEYGAIKWMLSIIKKGANNPNRINKELAKKYSEWTEAIVNTQRAGLISRMFELRLLERDRDGVAVTYKLFERGEKLLD